MSTITLPYDVNNGDILDADKIMANEDAIVSEYNTTIGALPGDILSTTETQSVTNKSISLSKIIKRVGTAVTSATHTIDCDSYDVFTVTAQAGDVTFANPSGTPVSGQTLVIRIKDDGTARAITWGANFRASSDLALPTTTILGKTLYVGFMWNSIDSRFDMLAKIDNI